MIAKVRRRQSSLTDHLTTSETVTTQDGGIWSPDERSFNKNGPLKGANQSSDRAEVRALVAALEKAEEYINVITDNQYVRDTAQYIATG
eukprot:6831607-Heterocapsa_arctica.AAC.1